MGSLWERNALSGPPGGGFEPQGRLDTRLGYGFALPDSAGLLTPYTGFGLAGDGAWNARLGTSLDRDGGRLGLDLEGAHRESPAGPESRISLIRRATF